MATASADSSSTDGQGCPICLEVFTSPRQLPCLHSFCEHCLQDYITKKASSTVGIFEYFICPVCRAVTSPARKDKLLGEWASLFPQSPFPLVGKSKVERACDICPSENVSNVATKLCAVCHEFMCDTCALYHEKMKISKTHHTIALEEWENNPGTRIRFTEGLGCPEHDDKDMEFYCRDHTTSCCGSCIFHYHKKCEVVLELKPNLHDLLKEMNPRKIMKQMQNLEEHLKNFLDMNEKNIYLLETQVSSINEDISRMREKLNTMLDDIEKMVKLEGNRLYKEWMIRKQEQNHQCQSLMNAIRNSQALLKTVSLYGSDTQMFLVTSKTVKQLHTYNDQIQEKFRRVDYIKLSLELKNNMKAVLAQDIKSQVKIVCREESKELDHKSVVKPLRERNVKLSEVIDIQRPSGRDPFYTGIIELPEGNKVLSDYNNKTCYLYDSSYKFVTSYTLAGDPDSMCLIDKNEIAVTMPNQKMVQFLSVRGRSLTNRGIVRTRCKCYGTDALNKEEIVVSGPCYDTQGSNKCYWSIINRKGKERLYHEFICNRASETCISLDTSKSRVYISVSGSHAVYSFGVIDGKQYLVYSSDDLRYPMGVAVDREDNVYVVGYNSNNIHKLAPDGFKLQVITSRVPISPYSIFFNRDRDNFVITNSSGMIGQIHYFVHE